MLPSILLIIALILVFSFFKKKSQGLTTNEKKKMLKIWCVVAAALVIAILAFSKGNVIAGAIASLVALFSRALPLLRYAPLFKGLFSQAAKSEEQKSNTTPTVQPSMDKSQAADILGVDIDASKEEVVAAHKRLMQKVHPDKGGSDALARQINSAKQALLDKNS